MVTVTTDPVMVSVCIPSYFQEKYIAQAIESVLLQKVKFSYEIVIVDDASKDGTQSIIDKYLNLYPSVIRKFYNKKNLGLTHNFYYAKCCCSGKYITMLAGDDYYIDEFKLQKQFDFIESNKEYSAVATVMEARYDNDDFGYEWFPKKKYRGSEFTLCQFLSGINFPLNGAMMYNYTLTEEGRRYFSLMPEASFFVDDITDCILLLKKGNVFIQDTCTIAHRVRRKVKDDLNYTSTQKGMKSFEQHIELLNNLHNHFKSEIDLLNRYIAVTKSALLYSLAMKQTKSFIKIYRKVPAVYKKCIFRNVFVCSVFESPSLAIVIIWKKMKALLREKFRKE